MLKPVILLLLFFQSGAPHFETLTLGESAQLTQLQNQVNTAQGALDAYRDTVAQAHGAHIFSVPTCSAANCDSAMVTEYESDDMYWMDSHVLITPSSIQVLVRPIVVAPLK